MKAKDTNIKIKKKVKAPDAIVLICILLIVSALLTYILPTGAFDMVVDPNTGREIADANSYHSIENNPISLWGVLKAIPQGMDEAASIINFLLIIGGVFGILQGTGALNALVGLAVNKLSGKERLIIPAILIIWGLGGAIVGNFEECLAFLPLQITLSFALGFDSLTGIGMGLFGVGAGYVGAILNPFTVGLAQEIAGVPMFSGILLRIVAFVVILGAAIIFLYRYAGKIKKNPELSPVYEIDKTSPFRSYDISQDVVEFTSRHKLVLLSFVVGIGILVYGVIKFGFYLGELGAIFIAIGIVAGLVGGLGINKIVEEFIKGAGTMVYAAIAVGFARGITLIMTEGNILDVIVYSVSSVVKGLPKYAMGVGMFWVQSIINIFIPSGTGQAVVSMPIMAPLADVIGVTRQTSVLAFQFGDGITNLVTPAAGDLMAALAMAKIPWGKWMKWFLPLLLTWYVLCSIILVIAAQIGYGPF